MSFVRERLLPYSVIIGFALACHGMLLLNDGTYWDDWVLLAQLDGGTWADQYRWNSEMGLPILAYLFWGLKLAGILGFHRVLAFSLIFISGILVYEIARRLARPGQGAALLIALFAVAYPGNQSTVLLSTFQYHFFYAMFLAATLLLLVAENPGFQIGRSACYGGAWLLFFVSFSMNSLLAFYFPVAGLCFLQVKRERAISFPAWLRTLAGGRAVFLVMPFIYWALKTVFFPAHGAYRNYNLIHLGAEPLRYATRSLVENAIYAQMRDALTGLSTHPALWAAALMVLGVVVWRDRRWSEGAMPEQIDSGGAVWEWLCFGLVLLACGIFPYAAVSAIPTRTGWDTRHAMLVALPMAILLTGGLRLLWGKGTLPRRLIAAAAGGSLLLAFSVSTNAFYMGWQARAVKDRAIIATLAAHEDWRPYSVYWIDDRYPLGGEPYYSFYEWSSLFKKVWGGETRIGLRVQDPQSLAGMRPYYNHRYNLAEFNSDGPQILLCITRGSLQLPEKSLVREYFWYRFFQPDRLRDFLGGVVAIERGSPASNEARPRSP
jgi:hypothetical protein